MQMGLSLNSVKYSVQSSPFILPAILLSTFLLALISGSLFFIRHTSHAVPGLSLVGPTPVMSISLSASSVNLAVSPSPSGTLASGSHTLSVTTDAPTGYKLSLVTSGVPSFPTTTATFASPAALPLNTWGYAIPGVSSPSPSNTIVNSFSPSYSVPTPSPTSLWANPSVATDIKKTTVSATNDPTTIYYGANINLDLPSGTYTNAVLYTVLPNLSDLPTPYIISVTPNIGDVAGGDIIEIVGTGFTVNDESITSSVTVGGLDCTTVSISSNTPVAGQDTIYCTTPAHAAGIVNVAVHNWQWTFTKVDSFTYTAPESFSFTIDTRLTSTGALTGTATTFSIPTSGYVGGASNHPYSWLVDCGNGAGPQLRTGTSGTAAPNADGIPCTYSTPGEYQITIHSNGIATMGWMNAFGFYSNTAGANAATNKDMFKSIDSPFTNNMRTKGATHRFAEVFFDARNATAIPANLFSGVSIDGDTDLRDMFSSTFSFYARNSTSAPTIPSGLFSSIDTSGLSGPANLSNMFNNTFGLYANSSTTVPTIQIGRAHV